MRVGSGNGSYQKLIENEHSFHQFLNSEESMMSYNTTNAEIVALGNVLCVDIMCLTYNRLGVPGTLEERTHGIQIQMNPELAKHNQLAAV